MSGQHMMLRMRIPAIRGVIDRRILVNYRVDPIVVSRILPDPFRPKLTDGYAIAGICLIRLRRVRPRVFQVPIGISSENAAHRIAVEWEDPSGVYEGVYIPRRDTNSRLIAYAGGKLFPGLHHHARFEVQECQERLAVRMISDDRTAHVSVVACPSDVLPSTSVFKSLSEASAFFKQGSLGYSPLCDPARFDGLELRCRTWEVEPLTVETVESSFFDDEAMFSDGSATFDCALLMRGIEHEWSGRESLCCPHTASAN